MLTKENDSPIDILKRAFSSATKEQCIIIGLLCWGLWFRRNKWIREKVNMSVSGVNLMVGNMLADWRKTQEIVSNRTVATRVNRKQWCKSQEGWIKN